MSYVARVPAVLRGMGVESNCTLHAWRERSSSGRLFTRCQIADDAPFLPDGTYEIVFAGQSMKTRKNAGGWELVFLSPEIDRALWPPPPEN